MRGYKVKITLNGSKPPVWRTCILPEGLALRELPDVFERVMGWRNSEHDPTQLARFSFPDAGETFESDGKDEDGNPVRWVEETVGRRMPGVTAKRMKPRPIKPDELLAGPLLAAAAQGSKEFSYTFRPDGAAWEHRVQIQKVLENGPGYPELLAHSGECPPAEYEGGIFRYQSLSAKDRKKLRAGHFPYSPEKIQERLQHYYTLEFKGGEKPREIHKIKISEDDMERAFKEMMKERDADAPEHFSYRDGFEKVTESDIDNLLSRWGVQPEELQAMDYSRKRDLLAGKYTEPGMLERYLRCVSDVEWSSIKNAVEWKEAWRYYLLPGEDDFSRLWWEGFQFCTDVKEVETPDEVREIFPRLDKDQFFQRRRREISWIRDCAEMAVQLYGFLPVSQLVKICRKKSGFSVNEAQVLGALEELAPVQRLHVLDESRGEIRHRELDPAVADSMRTELREGLEFMPIPLSWIGVSHGVAVFPEDRDSMERVTKQLADWAGDAEKAEGCFVKIAEALRARPVPGGDDVGEGLQAAVLLDLVLGQMMPDVREKRTQEEMASLVGKLMRLGRHIRLWALKGWTRDEVDRGVAQRGARRG